MTGTERDEEVSAPQASSVLAAECGTSRRTCPTGESPPSQAPRCPKKRLRRKWIKNRKQLTSQKPSSWCILLYLHPLALNFPAAALSCFSIRGRIRESRQVATFLPGPSGLFFLQLLSSRSSPLPQPHFQVGGVPSWAL